MSPSPADELAVHVAAVVAAAPPLTDQQLHTIVSVLAPPSVSDARPLRVASLTTSGHERDASVAA